VRHAKASQAFVTVIADKKSAIIEVSDNGQGFTVPESPAEFAPSLHFGLLGLHERAEMIGAALLIDSKPGQGTRLIIRLPLKNQNQTS
jgi:signal transduction histidine kinase